MIVKKSEKAKEMIQIVICEPNQYLLETYQNFLKYVGEKNSIGVRIKSFSSSNAMIFTVSGKEMYDCDMLIMNTRLAETDGLKVGREFREKGYEGELVYLTQDEDRVLEAFDVGALYYMVYQKVYLSELEQMFSTAFQKIEKKKKEAMLYRGAFGRRYIKYNEIWYLKVQDKKIGIYGENGKLLDSFLGSLVDVEEDLGEHALVRIHRSYIINLRYLKKTGKEDAILGTSIHIPIGIRYQKFLSDSVAASAEHTLL